MLNGIQDHHGGGLWAWEGDDPAHGEPFMVLNVAGAEWSSQFCADPRRLDLIRRNAALFYTGFPRSAGALGIRALLDTPIADAAAVATWVDSLCNASVPLPAAMHTGVLPAGAGYHHYPKPIVDINLFKRDDFTLFVPDGQGGHVAVAPVAPRGSGAGEVQVLYAAPSTALGKAHHVAHHAGKALVLPADSPEARAAFRRQQ